MKIAIYKKPGFCQYQLMKCPRAITMTKNMAIKNHVRRTWFLMAIFLVIVIALGHFISWYWQNPGFLYIAIFIALAMNFTGYWYSDKISLSLARAMPADRNQNIELFQVVENLSITAGLPMPRVYIIPDAAPNAFATGRDKNHAAVAVTQGLIGMMNKNELSGVIAHEISHIGNRDILLSTTVVVLVGFIAILANIFTRSMWFGGGRRNNDRDRKSTRLNSSHANISYAVF